MEKYFDIITRSLDTLGQGNILAVAVLFLVLALGEWGIPFPFVLQSVLFYIGYQLSHGSIQVLPLLLVLIAGRLAGSAGLFWSARAVGNPVSNWFAKRFRKIQNKLDRLKNNLGTRSPIAVAVGRLTPGLLVPTSLTSGAVGIRYTHFALGVTLSSVIWDGSFILSGIILGHGAQSMNTGVSTWFIPVGFFATICLIWGIQKFISQRKNREQTVNDEK